MAQTAAQIREQIKKLQAKEQALIEREVEGVVGRIKEAIAFYGLTPERLFGSSSKKRAASLRKPASEARPGRRTMKSTVAKAAAPAARKGTKGLKVAVKYRDEQGNAWSGRGSQPRWLRTALEAGKRLEDFAV
jgi:DNA-binding protein H-NS